MMNGRWAATWAVAGACGCAPAEAPAPPATVSLHMRGTPPDATVDVDEHAVGTLDLVAAHGVALPPGRHFVTVKAPGYFPFDRIVDAKAGAPPVLVEVTLVAVPE